MPTLLWLHYQNALPLLRGINIPKAVDLYVRGSKAMDEAKKTKGKNSLSISDVITILGPDFITDMVDVIQSIDPKSLSRLAMIVGASIEDLEEAELNSEKDKELMLSAGRLSAPEVISRVLFFIGMRRNPSSAAPSSSEPEGTNPTEETTPSTSTSDSSVAP